MCPVCLTTAAFIAAGTGTIGGLTALVLGKRSAPRQAQPSNPIPQPEER
jgi:hypothetical protein